MRKLQHSIDHMAAVLASVLLGAMIVILVYNVFARFMGGGIQWYMEASQYSNVWAMLIAGIGVCIKGEHLRINGLEQALKGKWKTVNRIIVSVITIVFYLFFAYGTYLLALNSRQEISTMAPLKMSYVYWLMPVTGILSAIATAIHLCIEIKETLNKEDITA